DYSALFPEGKTPRLKTSVEITPMKVNSDKSEWTWGMTYKDLAAMWWNIAGSGLKILPGAFVSTMNSVSITGLCLTSLRGPRSFT
ncbi:MAG: hypothetical protein NTY03_16275, partial [Candidatus Bathyarchaeota archaeon]|nr:hypothetical protein [Candidatus Bathyarchaeota archaeon]